MGNCFAALPIRITGAQWESIRRDAPPALRWFHRDDLHLTIAFLGRETPELLSAVREVLTAMPPGGFEVALGALRLLPSPRRFSALSFEITRGRDAAADLIDRWRNPLLRAVGRPRDDRPAFPHLTIARPARQHPDFRPADLRRWSDSLQPSDATLAALSPALFGWSPERPRRQFRIIPA